MIVTRASFRTDTGEPSVAVTSIVIGGALPPAGIEASVVSLHEHNERARAASLIERGIVGCLTTTGANLYHDAHRVIGHAIREAARLQGTELESEMIEGGELSVICPPDDLFVTLELALEAEACLRPLVHGGVEESEAAAAAALRRVHRDAGLPQQGLVALLEPFKPRPEALVACQAGLRRAAP